MLCFISYRELHFLFPYARDMFESSTCNNCHQKAPVEYRHLIRIQTKEVGMPEEKNDPDENLQSLVNIATAPRSYTGRCTCGSEKEKTTRTVLTHADVVIVKLQR